MRSVHPDAFERALAPIPRYGVVCIGVVPNDLRSTIKSRKKCDPSGQEMLPIRIRSTKKYFGRLFGHGITTFFRQCYLG